MLTCSWMQTFMNRNPPTVTCSLFLHTHTHFLCCLYLHYQGNKIKNLDLLFVSLARFKPAQFLVSLSNLPLLDFPDTTLQDDHYHFFKFLKARNSTSVGWSPVRHGIPLYSFFSPLFFQRKQISFFFQFNTNKFESVLY